MAGRGYTLNSGFSEILELRPVQEEALLHFIKREDVFAVLPSGCGKSLIFQLVPKICSKSCHRSRYLSLECLDLFAYILQLKEHGIPACSLADDDLLEEDVASHSIVFTSPELIVREEKWRKVLQSKSFLLLLKRLLSC